MVRCRPGQPLTEGMSDVKTWTYTAQIGVVATEDRRRDWAFVFYKSEKGLGQHHDLTEREKAKALESFATSVNETADGQGLAELSVTVEAEIEPEARRMAQALFVGIKHVGRLTLETPQDLGHVDGSV